MKKFAIAAALTAATFYALPASAADSLKFDGGIGAHPVGRIVNGAPELNTVRGVTPGGRPWAIQKLKATVRSNGAISVKGEGLVLAGGDTIGTAGAVLQVAATLFCGATGFTSPAANIDTGGNFEIRGSLSPLPTGPCNSPALLIRNATGGVLGSWFAAGTLATD